MTAVRPRHQRFVCRRGGSDLHSASKKGSFRTAHILPGIPDVFTVGNQFDAGSIGERHWRDKTVQSAVWILIEDLDWLRRVRSKRPVGRNSKRNIGLDCVDAEVEG